jgi:hypothetical protein
MYFVRRKGRIRGPLTLEKLQSLRDEDRLRMRDEIAESAEGPWSRLTDVYDELLGPETSDSDGPGELDDDFSSAPKHSSRRASPSRNVVTVFAKPTLREALLSGQLQPWQVIAAGVGLACLAVLAIAVGVMLSASVSVPREEETATVEERPVVAARPTQARPAQAKPAPAQQAKAPQVVAAAADPLAADPLAADSREAALDDPSPASRPESSPVPAPAEASADDPLADSPADPVAPDTTDRDHAAEIKATLQSYYAAGTWQERYRTAVPGDDVQKLMRSMYDDVDWVSVQWSIARMPEPAELQTAAQSGQKIRIDTVTNGNPHPIYLIFSQGRWRVDWLQSLNSLWLSK